MIQEGLGSIAPKEVIPNISMPPDTTVLCTVMGKVRCVMFFSSVLVVAGAKMSMHYIIILQ